MMRPERLSTRVKESSLDSARTVRSTQESMVEVTVVLGQNLCRGSGPKTSDSF